jgi:calcium-dependent protein kinase
MFKQIMEAINGMNKIGYLHRDLKLENIMLEDKTNPPTLKLIDFGMVVKLKEEDKIYRDNKVMGTPGYFAPESLLRHEYSALTDVWQAGCCLYSLLSGFFPFNPDQSIQITDFSFYPMSGDGWDNVSSTAKDLIAKILVKDPSVRISGDDILKHPWIAGDAPETDLGESYSRRIKNFALRNRMKKFFVEHDIEARNKETRRKLEMLLPGVASVQKISEKLDHFQSLMIQTMSSKEIQHSTLPENVNVSDGEIDFPLYKKLLHACDLDELATETFFQIFDTNRTGPLHI